MSSKAETSHPSLIHLPRLEQPPMLLLNDDEGLSSQRSAKAIWQGLPGWTEV